MKNLLMLVVALLTATMLFAATQTPATKGKELCQEVGAFDIGGGL